MKKRYLLIILILMTLLTACASAVEEVDGLTNTPTINIEPVPPQPTETPFIPPTIDPTCHETEMRGFRLSFDSAITGGLVDYRLFLPPCYDQLNKRLPVIYLLHGMVPGTELMNDGQWDDLGIDEATGHAIADGLLPPVIIVLPDGNDMRYESDEGPLVDVLVDELIPLIDVQYCTIEGSWGRAIGGLSRGGFWALSTAIQHPELFARVGGHSPFLYDGADYPANNPFNLADSALIPPELVIAVDHGEADFTAENTAIFIQKLRSRGLTPVYTVYPQGAHDEAYWAAHLMDYLLYYAEGWPTDLSAYPDCQMEG